MVKALRWIPPIREPYTLFLMFRDPRVPTYMKLRAAAIIALIFAYALSPIDIIPDYLPLAGWLDDLVLFPLGISMAERFLPQDLLLENRSVARQNSSRIIWKVALVVLAFFVFWALILTGFAFLILRIVN